MDYIIERRRKSIGRKKIKRIEAPCKVGVYMLRNKTTGNRYIGSATNVCDRLNSHSTALRLGYSINKKIDADIAAGHTEFEFLVLATYEDGEITNAELSSAERRFICEYGTESEYNYSGAAMRGVLPADFKLYAHNNLRRKAEQDGKKSRRADKL